MNIGAVGMSHVFVDAVKQIDVCGRINTFVRACQGRRVGYLCVCLTRDQKQQVRQVPGVCFSLCYLANLRHISVLMYVSTVSIFCGTS